MHPEQLLDCQADLLWRSEQKLFQTYIGGVVGSAMSVGVRNPRFQTEREDSMARMMSRALPTQVRTAHLYRVTADMSTVVEYAASQLDDSDTFDRNLAPTQGGLVHFEKPLPILDARGRIMLIHWMLWGPATQIQADERGNPLRQHEGASVCWFNDHFVTPDDYASEILRDIEGKGLRKKMLEVTGRWGFIGVDVIEQGKRIGGKTTPLEMVVAAAILADGDKPQPHTNTLRYVQALWLLLNQTITHTEEEYVRKTAVKRAKRVGLPGRVTVIDLRRMEYARQPGETLVEWSHRWVVRGHWRWQHHGEHNAQRKRIWVSGYVKGPSDKPLIVNEKVYNLRR